MLDRSGADRQQIAGRALYLARSNLDELLQDVAGQMASLNSVKLSTRHELLRKVDLARAYLHANTGRTVELAELRVPGD